ncbi:hypothetical protein O9992_18915 [Vibrio lentus]|nr:hypothetical protein [Vibrio lentus]
MELEGQIIVEISGGHTQIIKKNVEMVRFYSVKIVTKRCQQDRFVMASIPISVVSTITPLELNLKTFSLFLEASELNSKLSQEG